MRASDKQSVWLNMAITSTVAIVAIVFLAVDAGVLNTRAIIQTRESAAALIVAAVQTVHYPD